MCPQPPLLASTRRMKISWPDVRTQIDDDRLERFGVVARALEDHLVVVAAHEFHAGLVCRAAGDEKAGVRLRDFERRPKSACLAGRRSCETSNPPIQNWPGVLAAHAAAACRDRVALDRLAGKGLADGDPIVERPFFEVEVERLGRPPLRGSSPAGAGGRGRNRIRGPRGHTANTSINEQQTGKSDRGAHFVFSEFG